MPVHLAARDKVALFIPNGQYDPHTVHSNLFCPSMMICPRFSRVCIFEGMGGRGTYILTYVLNFLGYFRDCWSNIEVFGQNKVGIV